MTSRLAIPILLIVTVAGSAAAQAPAAAPSAGAGSVVANIASLGSLDDAIRTRAARALRRVPQVEAVPALAAAVRDPHADEYVRYRAFILLTSFDDQGMPQLVRDVLRDPNDRVRETAYKWLEQHPDAQLTPMLLGALRTEQAEFVRPALIDALAALGMDPDVQRALIIEIGRGLDVFRSAVIDSLGRHRATYAVDALAAIAHLEGPLQGDAILALGRIGGDRARAALAQVGSPAGGVVMTLRAAQCLAGDACAEDISALMAAASAASTRTPAAQAALGGLGNIAEAGHDEATAAILRLASSPSLRDAAAVVLAAMAVRQPQRMIDWLAASAAPVRTQALDLLKDGFESLEEDYGEEQFFAATRAAYWKAPENSPMRTLAASIIERLQF